MKDLERLRGKQVYFYRLRDGFRGGIVKRVSIFKRTRELRSLKVLTGDGRMLTIQADEMRCLNHGTGVRWFGKIIPLDDWLAS